MIKKKVPTKEGTDVEFVADNMILSHLSNKRKEFNMERFDKIFEYFDVNFKRFKLDLEEKMKIN